MVKTTIEAVFNEPIETIWHIVTDLTNADWRSDLSRIEVLEDKKEFIEYTNQGFLTKFVITAFEPLKLYVFTMENENISGKWVGEFQLLSKTKTKIHFLEDVSPKKIYMRPFVKSYLTKQQKRYVDDLTNYLANKE